MAPSRYLGLPWKPWGEVDFWLTQGLDWLDEQVCYCGSGLWHEDCVDPATEEHLEVVEEVHYGIAAIERWRDENKEADPGTQVRVRLLSPDERRMSPEERKRARAMAEIAEMKRRHGLT